MDSGASPPSSDVPDAKPSFRKPTNDAGSRKYRRRSPADLSASSSSDGSPDYLRSHSPHPSKVSSETDGYGRKNEDRDSDKQASARCHDSHTHDDHDKHHKDSVEVGKNGRKSFQSIQESRSGNHIEQGRDERHENKNRENSHRIDKYSDWHSKDKYEVDRCSRGKSDSRNCRSIESLDSHRHNGRQLALDRAVTGGRYGTSSYRDDTRTREQDRDGMSRERSRSGIRSWERGRDDMRNRDRERDDMRSRNRNSGRDDKRSREWERSRDKRDQDEKRGRSKSPRDYKNDNKSFREEGKGHVKGTKMSGDERAAHEKEEIHSIKQMDGDMDHKRKLDERDNDRHKDKFTQDPEMRTHYEVKGFSTVHDREKRDERDKDKFAYSVSESSPKKQRSGHVEKPAEEDDVKGLAKLKQVKETPADVTSEGVGSYSQSEANQGFNAAKVAAMKAAELVNKNLVAVGGGITGFLSTDQKKKLLWGNKKNPAAEDSSNRWDLPVFEDRERQEKFNKLMGVKGEAKVERKPDKDGSLQAEKQEQLQQDLEKQYTAGLRRRDGRTVGLGL